ncbi:PKD domain-containing protein [Agromyces agglutinans]|uniref:PKD domain-containing protein n=1 Tax=Agromyces agglutinans TaxID=2662258 RepID=UPI001FE45AC7|nr:PKD domain-containing protein [Agromyces agglutinans]
MTAGRTTLTLATGAIVLAGMAIVPQARPSAPAAVPADVTAVAGTLTFTASGDIGAGQNSAAVLSQIPTLGSELHLALGDLSYGATGAEESWCDFVTTRVGDGFPFELVSGNHESNGQNGNINDFSACLPNQLPGVVGTYGREYYVDVPQDAPLVRFVMISPDLPFPSGTWSYAAGSAHYAWTEAAIDGARAAEIPWVVVGMHKPCLSLGVYGCDPGADIVNLLAEKAVDLVLTGHEHLYQRTKQLALRSGCPSLVPGQATAACIADADDALVRSAGTVFATVGTGGVGLRDVNTSDPDAPFHARWSGLNATPSWGNLLVTVTPDALDAEFRPANGTFTDAFRIDASGAPPNTPPTAAFAEACTALACSFDAAASTDPDGTITSYAWAFGDGATGTGATATHTYGASGTYQVSLTVTDDDGGQGTVQRAVTVTGGGAAPLAADAFGRTVANGFGTADAGGAWTTAGTASRYSVSGGQARLHYPTAGITLNANLQSVSSTATDVQATLSPDRASSGSGMYLHLSGRRVPAVGAYQAKVRLLPSGQVDLSLVRVNSSNAADVTIQGSTTVIPSGFGAGDRLRVRVQVLGTGPTTIRAKAWEVGQPEPAAWQRSATDATPALQAPGHVGVAGYLSGSATGLPYVVAVDDFVATAQ